jgi:hypothetical protein
VDRLNPGIRGVNTHYRLDFQIPFTRKYSAAEI